MLRTKSGLPKHCCWNIDRHGKRRVRFRKGGFSTYLNGIPWSEDFMRQYATALTGVKAQTSNIGAGRTVAGSVAALVAVYIDPLLKVRRSRRPHPKPSAPGETSWSAFARHMGACHCTGRTKRATDHAVNTRACAADCQ